MIQFTITIILYFIFINLVNILADKYLIKQPIKWKVNIISSIICTILYSIYLLYK